MSDELAQLLAKIGLEDYAQIDYARGILLDDADGEDEDRQEAILSLIEEPADDIETSFPSILATAKDMREKDQVKQAADAEQLKARQREEAERKAQEAKKAFEAQKESQAKEVSKKPVISAEEKARLMQQYGHVLEGEEPELDGAESSSAPGPQQSSGGKKKKGKEELPSDLLSIVNDNKAKVQDAQRQKKEDAAKQSIAKKAKDKADLEKQRADQEKRKKDAQDRAKKQERRA